VPSRAASLPDLAWQGSLLGDGDPTPDATFATVERIDLGDGAWVDVAPGWLQGADTLFERLLATVAWQEREVPMYDQVLPEPRLSHWWGARCEAMWPEGAAAIAEALGARYGTGFDSLGANLYRDGRDSVAWHGDRVYREQDVALVAVLSLGSQRRFLLRPKGGGASVRIDPAPGDLLVMGGTCQRTWQHCVPKTARPIGPRMSVTLRHRRELRPTNELATAGDRRPAWSGPVRSGPSGASASRR
jgi:alkylated DNA repair dioxygenase AlkB